VGRAQLRCDRRRGAGRHPAGSATAFHPWTIFERHQIPFIVAINCFDDAPDYDPDDVRIALDLDPRVPAMLCDARQVSSVKQVLIALVEHILGSPSSGSSDPTPVITSITS